MWWPLRVYGKKCWQCLYLLAEGSGTHVRVSFGLYLGNLFSSLYVNRFNHDEDLVSAPELQR
jgi:hypothetical protein